MPKLDYIQTYPESVRHSALQISKFNKLLVCPGYHHMISVAYELIPNYSRLYYCRMTRSQRQYYLGTNAAVSESNYSEHVEEIFSTYKPSVSENRTKCPEPEVFGILGFYCIPLTSRDRVIFTFS